MIRATPEFLNRHHLVGLGGTFPTHLFLQKHRGANAISVPPGRGSTVDGRSSSRRRRSASRAAGWPWWLVAPLGMVTRYPKLFNLPKKPLWKGDIPNKYPQITRCISWVWLWRVRYIPSQGLKPTIFPYDHKGLPCALCSQSTGGPCRSMANLLGWYNPCNEELTVIE